MNGGRRLVALLAGLQFGIGLAVSGMLDPERVQAFLDISGAWDPTLGYVLGAAVVVTFAAVRFAETRLQPVLGGVFDLPTRRPVDAALVAGSAMFGIGWGLAGFCPGPGLAATAMGLWQPALFVGAMLAGMSVHDLALARGDR